LDKHLKEEITSYAIDEFKRGYFCSEIILRAFEKFTNYRFSEEIHKGMTAFAEGIGSNGCICGAASAVTFIISTFEGRTDNKEDYKNAFNLSNTFMKEFKKEYGSACCRVITKNAAGKLGFGKFKHCPYITAFCALKVVELAQKHEWI